MTKKKTRKKTSSKPKSLNALAEALTFLHDKTDKAWEVEREAARVERERYVSEVSSNELLLRIAEALEKMAE